MRTCFFIASALAGMSGFVITDFCCGSYLREIMLKFDFSVNTRDGQKVESIQIYGKDLPDAERKLRQMYHHCEVINCKAIESGNKLSQSADIEELLSLIAKQD